jgi:zinc protease
MVKLVDRTGFIFFRELMMRYRISCLLILAAIVWCGAPALAQKPAPLPELSFKRLLNDLQVIVASSPNMGKRMAIGLAIRYGASFDPVEKRGLANLTRRMLMRATAERSLKDIENELASLGADIDIQCDWDGFRFVLRASNSGYERALLLLYQIVCEPVFTEADLLSAKKEILQQLQKPSDPRKWIHSQIENLLFQGTTYGRPLEGTPKSLESITLGDVRFFHKKFFSSGEASLLVVGDISAAKALPKISRIWGLWIRNEQVPFTLTPPKNPAGKNIVLVDDPNTPAAQFILGNLFARRDEPAYFSAILASRILQDRLTKLLPTSLITVDTSCRRISSLFYIQGQAAADQAADQVEKIHGAVDAMKEKDVDPEELAAVQKRWIEEFNRELATTEGICRIMLESELYRLGTNYAALFPEIVMRCDAGAIKQAAKDWIFPGGEVILLRGPVSILKPAFDRMSPPPAP